MGRPAVTWVAIAILAVIIASLAYSLSDAPGNYKVFEGAVCFAIAGSAAAIALILAGSRGPRLAPPAP